MGKPTQIRRNLMLKEMDVKWLPNGKRNTFSIKFVTKSGNIHFFKSAFMTGLPYNVKEFRQRGIQPCNEQQEPIDHVYPVGIDAILMFNLMEVIL